MQIELDPRTSVGRSLIITSPQHANRLKWFVAPRERSERHADAASDAFESPKPALTRGFRALDAIDRCRDQLTDEINIWGKFAVFLRTSGIGAHTFREQEVSTWLHLRGGFAQLSNPN
jgi:hypothetical protein